MGTLVITPNEFVSWMKENANLLTDYNGTKQLKLQILKGEKGIYFTVDTFVPKKANAPSRMSDAQIAEDRDGLPF